MSQLQKISDFIYFGCKVSLTWLQNIAQPKLFSRLLRIILCCCLMKHFSDGLNSAFGRDNFNTGTVWQHQSIELEVENYLALKKDSSVFIISFEYHLRTMYWLRFNVWSLLTVCNESDGFKRSLSCLGYANDILEECWRVEVGVFLKSNFFVWIKSKDGVSSFNLPLRSFIKFVPKFCQFRFDILVNFLHFIQYIWRYVRTFKFFKFFSCKIYFFW